MSREKFVFFGALPEKGGSGYARFFALSQEVHFRSMIGVYSGDAQNETFLLMSSLMTIMSSQGANKIHPAQGLFHVFISRCLQGDVVRNPEFDNVDKRARMMGGRKAVVGLGRSASAGLLLLASTPSCLPIGWSRVYTNQKQKFMRCSSLPLYH